MNSDRMSLVSVIVAALLLPAAGAQAVIRYVSTDGSNTDGLTWATAYKTIQAAIGDPLMVGGGEIRVKQGVYGTGLEIEVRKAVRILGGYSGAGDTPRLGRVSDHRERRRASTPRVLRERQCHHRWLRDRARHRFGR